MSVLKIYGGFPPVYYFFGPPCTMYVALRPTILL